MRGKGSENRRRLQGKSGSNSPAKAATNTAGKASLTVAGLATGTSDLTPASTKGIFDECVEGRRGEDQREKGKGR